MKAIVVSYVHIPGFKADFDGQVACNCTILKGRVKRGPGKGRPTYRVKSYFDLESFRKEWNRTRNKAFPIAMTVTEEGEVGVVKKESAVLTDEEFLDFLKGDMLGAKLVAYDKDGKEIDPMSIDPLMVAKQSHDQDLLNEYLEANGGLSDVRAINKPIVERPPHSYRAVIEGIAKEGESE